MGVRINITLSVAASGETRLEATDSNAAAWGEPQACSWVGNLYTKIESDGKDRTLVPSHVAESLAVARYNKALAQSWPEWQPVRIVPIFGHDVAIRQYFW